MRPDRWKRLQELFDRAVEMEPAPRKTYLDEACGDDREMLRQVESLILAGDQVGSFLEDAVQDAMERSAEEPIPTMEGERLGAYEIRSLIDRGGMGEVYLAVRADDEFDMQVAIKVVRSGLETPEQLRRFQSERQILATLDHPGIANLLDGR